MIMQNAHAHIELQMCGWQEINFQSVINGAKNCIIQKYFCCEYRYIIQMSICSLQRALHCGDIIDRLRINFDQNCNMCTPNRFSSTLLLIYRHSRRYDGMLSSTGFGRSFLSGAWRIWNKVYLIKQAMTNGRKFYIVSSQSFSLHRTT